MSNRPANADVGSGAAATDRFGATLPGLDAPSRVGGLDVSCPAASPTPRPDTDLVLDVTVVLTVELGRTFVLTRSVLRFEQGSVIELDGSAGQPLNVHINGHLIAQGELLVVNDRFGIRLTDIVPPTERTRAIQQ